MEKELRKQFRQIMIENKLTKSMIAPRRYNIYDQDGILFKRGIQLNQQEELMEALGEHQENIKNYMENIKFMEKLREMEGVKNVSQKKYEYCLREYPITIEYRKKIFKITREENLEKLLKDHDLLLYELEKNGYKINSSRYIELKEEPLVIHIDNIENYEQFLKEIEKQKEDLKRKKEMKERIEELKKAGFFRKDSKMFYEHKGVWLTKGYWWQYEGLTPEEAIEELKENYNKLYSEKENLMKEIIMLEKPEYRYEYLIGPMIISKNFKLLINFYLHVKVTGMYNKILYNDYSNLIKKVLIERGLINEKNKKND